MEKAIIIARCSTNENKQDVSRQSKELRKVYGSQYEIIKEFNYYKSGTANDEVNKEILEFAINNNIKHIIAFGDFPNFKKDIFICYFFWKNVIIIRLT